jgi:hypothetical protein
VTPDEFERAFIARCEALAQERGLSQSELARRVWPSKGDPIKHWHTLRNQGSRLPMVDAFHLAGALEVDFSALCWGLQQQSTGIRGFALSPGESMGPANQGG